MKKLKWIIPVILIIALAGYFIMKPRLDAKNLEFTYTTFEIGDIEANISSTGTLEAINTVEIGTQISGTIERIYVDYNDKVVAGQLLAEMDLKLLNTNLISAKANLSVSKAQLNQAKTEFDRDQNLYDQKVIPERQFTNSKFTYEQAKSARDAASAAVKNIQVSMGYAKITSPISGTVTERSVEEGQTVAASFSTPTLFIIAEDLSQMQILADVDESDIGYIKNQMKVRFTVQTYPETYFLGNVSQIRLQPIKVNNVVNYQVVVDVDNREGKLLPGMTANLEFITETAKNVLLLNNSAFRFRPTEDMLEEIKPLLIEKANRLLPDSLQQNFESALNNDETYTPANYKKKLPSKFDGFFYKGPDGKLDFKFVEIGIKSGLQSEITRFLDGTPLKSGNKAVNSIKSQD
ncbi:efflux RND transporter periplasmic adaptor subunit [Winogradskyella bathintestinalis]|uniref:Efflux RND transporter periplasmic adaptor subunit n=1 Tax=Winogradskyella bathintestinalis TaxID=3035208 RepID=A0ABT7ZW48_9FLAO|nr:efflux RND transporter periplasmic adaptor subunit [Winogradskyella bathintestinalis]MDN3493246.1 efflux RND transporter periplasmic adaptor subunit [Winogradskyella bathintestinalis]